MTTVTLGMSFYDTVLPTTFNDSTQLAWNPTQDPSTAKLIKTFGAMPVDLPQAYKDVVIMQDTAPYTFIWFVQAPEITIGIPAGPLTLGSLMTTLYQASSQPITADQYANITYSEWDGQDTPKVSDAVVYGQTGSVRLGSLALLDPGTVFLRVVSSWFRIPVL